MKQVIYQLIYITGEYWWTLLDLNQRTRKRADLQSAAINHSAKRPQKQKNWLLDLGSNQGPND